MLHHENHVVKNLPWLAFKLADSDWQRVVDVRDILQVCEVASLSSYLEVNTYIYTIGF